MEILEVLEFYLETVIIIKRNNLNLHSYYHIIQGRHCKLISSVHLICPISYKIFPANDEFDCTSTENKT